MNQIKADILLLTATLERAANGLPMPSFRTPEARAIIAALQRVTALPDETPGAAGSIALSHLGLAAAGIVAHIMTSSAQAEYALAHAAPGYRAS